MVIAPAVHTRRVTSAEWLTTGDLAVGSVLLQILRGSDVDVILSGFLSQRRRADRLPA